MRGRIAILALFILVLLGGFALSILSSTGVGATPFHACSMAFNWNGEMRSAPLVVWALLSGDLAIFGWYMLISFFLLYYLFSSVEIPFPDLVSSFAGFIFLCGITHLMKVVVLFRPLFALEAAVEHACSAMSMFAFLIVIVRYRTLIDFNTAIAKLRIMAARDIPELRQRASELEQAMDRRSAGPRDGG